MALGAQDVQPSCRHHLFMFFLDLLTELLDEFTRQFVPLRVIIFIFKLFFRQTFRQMFGIAAEHDVRSAPGHIGGDRHGLVPSGLRDDVRLAFVIFGVQDLMGDPLLLEYFRKHFGFLDGDGAYQNRLAALMEFFNLGDNGVKFLFDRFVDAVRVIDALQFTVGGHGHHIEVIDLLELVGLGVRGTGHAGEFLIHAKIILEGDRRQRLVLAFDFDAFLGLNGLVQPVGPAASGHQPSGKFIDDEDLTVAHDVFDVLGKEFFGL